MHPGTLWAQHALNLAIRHTGLVTCVSLPAHDLTRDPIKQNIIYPGAQEGRIAFLTSHITPNIWIIIFIDAATRVRMMTTPLHTSDMATWLSLMTA